MDMMAKSFIRGFLTLCSNKVSNLSFMFTPEAYLIAAEWFPRLLGLIYLFAIGAFIFQITGLIGENGILPIRLFHERIKRNYGNLSYILFPSIFWIDSSNKTLMAAVIGGSVISI